MRVKGSLSIAIAAASATALSAVALWSAPVAACSMPCPDDTFTPSSSVVPANVGGAVWRPYQFSSVQDFDGDDLRLVHVGTGDEVTATFAADAMRGVFKVEFGDLEPGAEYRFEAPWSCDVNSAAMDWTFEAGAAAEFPSELGTLEASPQERDVIGLYVGAPCYTELESVYIDIELALPTEAEPWRDALIFETLVDGEVWRPMTFEADTYSMGSFAPGESSQGRGRDRIHATCGTAENLNYDNPATPGMEGTRTVSMRAWLPGRTAVLVSNTIEIVLDCSVEGDDPDTGHQPGDPDAGEQPGSDAGDEGSTDSDDADGCGGCASTGSPSPMVPGLMLLALGMLITRLRRR